MPSWIPEWDAFPPVLREFWIERHLGTLTTVRPDGRPHTVPVGVVLDHHDQCAWVIASGDSYKARRIAAGPAGGVPVSVCQVDGKRWCTVEGLACVQSESGAVRRAEECYAARYRTPKPNPMRVAIRIEVERFLLSRALLG
jgi:PPOX class probable F420-dependent enzyme